MRVWAVVLIIEITSQGFMLSGTAHAGGLEYAGAGTQALGRGGAVAARADDPMVLMYNPAGLVELRGVQLMLNANLALLDACVAPIGYYGWGLYGGGKPSQLTDPRNPSSTQTFNFGDFLGAGPAEMAYTSSPLDKVCLDQGVTPVPEFAVTARLSERIGIGIGMIFPGITPQGRWGGPTGLIRNAAGELRPAATRYMMMNSGTSGMFPTIGLAFKAAQWLRFGATFQWGVVNVNNTTMAGILPGTIPANDTIAHVRGVDWFIPEFTGSVHIVPLDAIDVVLGVHYQGDLDASGKVDLTSGTFRESADAVPWTTTNTVTNIRQKFPWQAWAGLRYAYRLAPRPRDESQNRDVRDAFSDEVWDVEVDTRYEMNARHKDVTLDYVQGQFIEFRTPDGISTNQAFPDPSVPRTVVEKRWQDQMSLRVGGSYNVVPGVFGISAGAHWENRGVDPSYMQIDYWPLSRLGLHFGVHMRVAGFVDLYASYAHIAQETLVVGAPDHAPITQGWTEFDSTKKITTVDKRIPDRMEPLNEPQIGSVDGRARLTQNLSKVIAGQPPFIVNSGTYSSSLNVVSVGVNMHF